MITYKCWENTIENLKAEQKAKGFFQFIYKNPAKRGTIIVVAKKINKK